MCWDSTVEGPPADCGARFFTVLRLALPRTSIKDITYNGIVIPKGTVFFLNAWACNMGKLQLPGMKCHRASKESIS